MNIKVKGDPENARLINRSLILNELRMNDMLSRADLARTLKLSKMTISSIVTDLINEQFICETGIGDSMKQGGRKPILLTLSTSELYVIGVDIGKTNTAVSLGNLKGKLIQSSRVPTRRNHDQESILGQISELVNDIIVKSGISRKSILGVGVSIGGLVNKKSGYISLSPDFNWKDVPLKDLLENVLELPVIVDNCSRVMALGEKWHGSASLVNNFFFINVGFGIGSAIVIKDQIYDKNSEFGHIFITVKDVRCDCGNYGCLESVASGQAIERIANEKLSGKQDNWYTAKDVAELALKGDMEAKKIFQDAGRYLGRALSMAANLFNPDKIIIGGGVSNSGEILLGPLKDEFDVHSMEIINDTTQIELSELGMDAGVIGAVSLALDNYIFHSDRI